LAIGASSVKRREQLVDHHEGVGKLHKNGDRPVPVRYIVDTWRQSIATGSGTSSEVKRMDGVLWWEKVGPQPMSGTLELEDGRTVGVILFDVRSNRASFHCK
jgi:hypothetical protein